jgi:NAD-dependent SIR2 family protein deacetylase
LGADIKVEPSDSHKFLALLEQQNKLLRVYTQNIDGLEEIAGVSSKRMVYAHGSLQWTQCCRCHHKVPASQILDSIKNGVVPLCNAPKNNVTKPKGKMRSPRQRKGIKSNPLCLPQLSTPFCQGVLKPGVTFFGEILNDNVSKCLEADRDKADALIVIGTSLSVAPISKIISYLPPKVPRLLINRTIVSAPTNLPQDIDDFKNDEKEFRKNYTFDAYLLGFCDDVTRALVNRMNHTTKFSNEGKLAANLKVDDPMFSLVDWNSMILPRERLFLFPGAIVTGTDDDDLTYTEIAHCDGCGSKINGTIRKCIECFDFDLCHLCYPDLLESHFGGSHTFLVER